MFSSLCFAPCGAEIIGLAYANRSAVYLAMGYYEKALENIELARNKYPKDMLDKLKYREEQCLEKLNNEPTKNEFLKNEIYREKVFKKNTLPGNKKTSCYIADCLEVKTSPEWGRYVVTNKDLEVGKIIWIEDPFATSLESTARYQRCANCMKTNMLNLLPCEFCCSTMFCSEECRKIGQDKFHQYDCGVVNVLDKLMPYNSNLTALATFFEALNILNNDPHALNDFLHEFKNTENLSAFDFDFSKMNEDERKKSLLKSVLSFVSHESSRSNFELIDLSVNTALLTNLMLNHSKLGSILDDETRVMFRKFMFKQLQISLHNSYGLFAVSRFVTANGVGEYLSGSCP